MKNLFLTVCMCMATAAFAQNNAAMKIGAKLYEPQLKAATKWANGKTAKPAPAATAMKADAVKPLTKATMPSPTEYMKAAEAAKTQRLDSIIGYINNGKDKYTRQYFTFDAKNNPVKRTNSYWNTATGIWEDAEYTEYKVDEDGYVTEMSSYSAVAGQRYVYEYDDKKRGIVQELWEYNGSTWTPLQRGDYKYDDRDNIVEEMLSAWDSGSETWVKAVLHEADYNDKNQQTGYRPYEWNGSEWVGVGEAKSYIYTADGTNYNRVTSYIWETGTKSWFEYCRNEQDFNADGNCTRREKMFYNKDLGNWAGAYEYDGYVYTNTKATLEYDELGRLKYEVAYVKPTTGDYIKSADVTYEWTDLENGVTQCVMTDYLGYESGEPYVTNISTTQYDTDGNEIYMFEQHRNTAGELADYMKRTHEYDKDGNMLSERQWAASGGTLKPYTGSDYTYNDHGMVTDQQAWKGQAGSSEWVKGNHFTYTYEQDTVLVDKKCYSNSTGEEMPSWGEGNKFEYDVPVEDILLWPGGVFYHKLVEQYSYSGVGSGWDTSMMQVYHYSDMTSTSINNITAGESTDVILKYARNMLHVEADGNVTVNIYGISGVKELSSTEELIDLSGLPDGVYVVEAGGQKLKIMKR